MINNIRLLLLLRVFFFCRRNLFPVHPHLKRNGKRRPKTSTLRREFRFSYSLITPRLLRNSRKTFTHGFHLVTYIIYQIITWRRRKEEKDRIPSHRIPGWYLYLSNRNKRTQRSRLPWTSSNAFVTVTLSVFRTRSWSLEMHFVHRTYVLVLSVIFVSFLLFIIALCLLYKKCFIDRFYSF